MPHIAILIHSQGELDETQYCMSAIAKLWRADGITVSVLRGPGPVEDVDLAIMHVDLTRVPQDHLKFIQQFPNVINGTVADISKRFISRNLVARGDGYNGPVIVKTDCNFGGYKEADLSANNSLFGRIARAMRRRLPWSYGAELDVWNYPIYDRADQVPRSVWKNPNLIVERFLSERQNGLYCTRSWMFLGDQERNMLMYAKVPIIKSKVAVKIEEVPVPDELRKIRRQLGFDFGKFDYGIVDGRVVLYDANRTPFVGQIDSEYAAVIRRLANGVHPFLTRSGPVNIGPQIQRFQSVA